MELNTVFSPMKIGSCEIPNRLVVPAMVTNYCTKDGILTDRYLKYMEEKAKGGWGLIITEDYAVQEHGKGYERIPGFWKPEHVARNKELTALIHRYPSKIFCQMYHPGRQSSMAVNGGVMPVAPSGTKDPMCFEFTRGMTVEEIHQLVEDFGTAAARCKESGFDGIELHCAHGYLLAEFLSPYVNKRTDQYGGCFQNRVRIVDEIYASMRKAVGPDFPLIVRFSRKEFVEGGRTEAESYELALHFQELGFDAVHVSNGVYAAHPRNQIIAPMFTDHAFNMDAAEQIKKLLDVPVILTNRINDPQMAETLLRMGKADFIGMGRGSLADPFLPQKAKEGKYDQIQYSIGCLQGCEMPLFLNDCVTCLINPRVGREFEVDLTPAPVSKKVMVIGGGPAGLVAARTAALRGHQVTVYEAQEELGGQFRSAAYPMGKGELSTLTSSLRAQLKELQVPVLLNTAVDEALIQAEKPDAVVIATGAKPLTPAIPGMEGSNVLTAEEVLLGKKDIGNGPCVVCGGGEVGGETAQFLAERNHDVTILEMQGDILNDMMPMTRTCLMEMLAQAGVKVMTGCKVSQINQDSVSYQDAQGQIQTIPADSVISAFGYQAYNPLEAVARSHCGEVYVIGGAVKAGNAITATKEGYETGLKL